MTPGLAGAKSFFNWVKVHYVWAIIIIIIIIPVMLMPIILRGTTALSQLPVIGPLIAKLPSIGGGATA